MTQDLRVPPGSRLKAGTMGRADARAPGVLTLYDPLSDTHSGPGYAADATLRYYFDDPRGGAAAWNLELSDRCTLSCRHCHQRPVKCEPWDGCGTVHRDGWPGLLQSLLGSGAGEVSLSGGEVMLFDRMAEVLAGLHSAGVPVRILLTGMALWQRRSLRALLPVLAKFGVVAKVPIYSHREAAHDWVTRSPGSLTDSIKLIGDLQNAGVEVTVSYLILGPIAEDAPVTVGVLRGLVGERFSISTLVYPARTGAGGRAVPMVSPAQMDMLLARAEFSALPVEYLSFQPRCASGCRFPTVLAGGQAVGCTVCGASACGDAYGDGESLRRAADWSPGPLSARCTRCPARFMCKRCHAFGVDGIDPEPYCGLVGLCAAAASRRIERALAVGFRFLHEEAGRSWEQYQAGRGSAAEGQACLSF